MPGSSLWLVPPHSSTYNQELQTLISNTVPARFPQSQTHQCLPHVTVTSQIDPSIYEHDPQAWISRLRLGPLSQVEPVLVDLTVLEPGDPFVKKLTVRAAKHPQLLDLAAACRAEAVSNYNSASSITWAHEEYSPHLSLMYADMPASEVRKSMALLDEDCRKTAAALSADVHGIVATGGKLVLVDTSKPISVWHPIAELELPHLQWTWPWSKPDIDE